MRMGAGLDRNGGFTLVDALVACALLTGGLVVVAGALDSLAKADSATEARVQAGALAASILAELRGLPIESVLHYSPPADTPGLVHVELVNSAGQPLALPVKAEDVDSFPPQIEAHIKAGFKDMRGHIIEVQTVGFLTR